MVSPNIIDILPVPAQKQSGPQYLIDQSLLSDADQLVKNWADPKKRDQIDVNEVAKIANGLHQQLLGITRNFEKDFAIYAIWIGRLLLIVQKKIGRAWEVWAYTHLKCGGKQTLQKYMDVGKVNGAEKYAGFGITRLLKLIRSLSHEDKKAPDPIGNFLKRHQIFFDPEEDPPYNRFNLRVDTVVALEKAEKAGLKVDPEHVTTLVKQGKGLKPEIIAAALNIQNCGGNTDQYFRNIIGSGGQSPTLILQESKGKDVRRLIAELNQTIEQVIKNNYDVEGTYPEDIQQAVKMLMKFKTYLIDN